MIADLGTFLAALALVLAVVALLRRGPRGPKGDKGDPGITGEMGMPGPKGDPGKCPCQDLGPLYADKPVTDGEPPLVRRYPVRDDATAHPHDMDRRFRAVVRWNDREIIGYGPHQATLRAAEADGRACIERHWANWYTVEEWSDGAWVEAED